jgi:hypothetical protein
MSHKQSRLFSASRLGFSSFGGCCWIGQGFWQNAAAPLDATPNAFRLAPEFWTIRTMALLGAVLFAAYGILELRTDWALGGDYAYRAVGGLVAYAAVGAIFGAVIARFLPKP